MSLSVQHKPDACFRITVSAPERRQEPSYSSASPQRQLPNQGTLPEGRMNVTGLKAMSYNSCSSHGHTPLQRQTKLSRETSKPFLLLDNTARNRSMKMIKIQMSILSFLRAPQYSFHECSFRLQIPLLGFCHPQSTFHISKITLGISKIFCSRSGGTTPRQLQPHSLNPHDQHHQGYDLVIPSSCSKILPIFPFSWKFTKFPDLVHSISLRSWEQWAAMARGSTVNLHSCQCAKEHGELQHSSSSAERQGLPSTRWIPPASQNCSHCGFRELFALLLSFILFLRPELEKAGFTQVVSQYQGPLADNQFSYRGSTWASLCLLYRTDRYRYKSDWCPSHSQ